MKVEERSLSKDISRLEEMKEKKKTRMKEELDVVPKAKPPTKILLYNFEREDHPSNKKKRFEREKKKKRTESLDSMSFVGLRGSCMK